MKNKSILILLMFLTSVVLSSCSSGLSITKRRYNKGFYVHRAPSASASKKQQTMEQSTSASQQSGHEQLADGPKKSESDNKSVQAFPQKPDLYSQVARSLKKPAKFAGGLISNLPGRNLKRSRPAEASRLDEFSGNAAADGEKAFDIIWLIIVVLAVVYLVGLLLDVAGGSWLIHLLALIVIILLIFKLIGML